MTFEINLNTLIEGVILLVISLGVKGNLEFKKDLKKDLGVLNNDSIAVKAWTVAHDKQDDERYKEILSRIGHQVGGIQ